MSQSSYDNDGDHDDDDDDGDDDDDFYRGRPADGSHSHHIVVFCVLLNCNSDDIERDYVSHNNRNLRDIIKVMNIMRIRQDESLVYQCTQPFLDFNIVEILPLPVQ